MKSGFLIIVFYFLGSSLLYSQWSKVYGIDSNSEIAQSILSLDDGFVILGSSNTTELWLLRTDLNGDTLWTKKYSESLLHRPNAKIYANDVSGFFLTFTYATEPSWIYKLDSFGKIIWKKELENNTSFLHLDDNSFLALGNKYDSLSLNKISENGDFSFQKKFVEKSIFYDSKILLTSTTNNKYFITIANAVSQFDALTVIEVNSNCDSLWTSSFKDIFPYSVYINQISNGDIFLTGNSGRSNHGLTGKGYLLQIDSTGNEISREFNDSYLGHQYSTNDSCFIKIPLFSRTIIKTDVEHKVIWENNLCDKLNLIYDPMFMCFTELNSAIFFGFDEEFGQILFHIDSDGKLLWQKFLANDLLSLGYYNVISLPQHEYVVSGSTIDSDSSNLYTDIKILKFLAPTKVELLFYPKNNETIMSDSLDVKITSNIFNSNIFYTLNGTEPTIQSFHYTSPIRIDSNVVIKAIAYAPGYEDSEIVSKEYTFLHKINVELEDIYIGVDSNFAGSAFIKIKIPKPTSYLGDAISVKWIFNNMVIGEGENLYFNFQTGTNKLILETIDIEGNVQYDTTKVTVYSSYYSNTNEDIADYFYSISSLIKKNPVSQFSTGEFLFLKYNSNQQSSALLDSTSLVLSERVNPLHLSTACIINDTTYLSSFLYSYASALFNNPLSNNWNPKLAKIDRAEKIITSISYLPDSLVLVGTQSGKIYCNSITIPDSIFWKFDCSDTIKTDIIISDEKDIIFGCANNNLYSLSSDGNLNWKYDVGTDFESTPALGTDSSIIFGANDYKLYNISNSGTKNWEFETNGKITSSPVIDYYGNIYFGSNDGGFYSVNSNGELNWKYFLGIDEDISASIGNNGLIYTSNGSNIIYVFDRYGKIKWQFEVELSRINIDYSGSYIDEEIATAPLITKTNLILIETTFGNIYIIKENPTYYLAEELPQWSTFKGSNQRTGISPYHLTTFVKNTDVELPIDYSLSQNYPNPFNPSTKISYSIPQSSFVNLRVFDILGQEIAVLVNREQTVGSYEIEFNASNLTSGIYFYRLQSNSFAETKKLVLLR